MISHSTRFDVIYLPFKISIILLLSFGITLSSAQANITPVVIFEDNQMIKNLISNLRSDFHFCPVSFHLPNYTEVINSSIADELAQEISENVVLDMPVDPSAVRDRLNEMLDANLKNPAENIRWFNTEAQDYNQAFENWLYSEDSCFAMSTATGSQTVIGIGKTYLDETTENAMWTLLIYEERIMNVCSTRLTNLGRCDDNDIIIAPSSASNNVNPFASLPLKSNDKPDLVITNFGKIGRIDKSNSNQYHAKVRIVVKNQGTVKAGKFNISVHASLSTGGLEIPIPFVVDTYQANAWIPKTHSPLMSDDSVELSGELYFHPSLIGKTINVIATADYCINGKSCLVQESNEANNRSNALTFNLSVPTKIRTITALTSRN